MCGICGFISQTHQDTKEAVEMWRRNESRGGHAWGWATVRQTEKAPGKIPAGISIPRTNMIIMHTRFATNGKPEINDNNHPHVAGDWIIVHNGILSGAHERQKTECDSEQIVKYMLASKMTEPRAIIKEMAESLEGSFRIAIISKKIPNKMWLVSDYENIQLGLNAGTNTIYFASERKDIPGFCWESNTEKLTVLEIWWDHGKPKFWAEKFKKKVSTKWLPNSTWGHEEDFSYGRYSSWETAVCEGCQGQYTRSTRKKYKEKLCAICEHEVWMATVSKPKVTVEEKIYGKQRYEVTTTREGKTKVQTMRLLPEADRA